ncbi:hypothetical protein Hanom_Chr09g00864831 [Helianthus anomalus]
MKQQNTNNHNNVDYLTFNNNILVWTYILTISVQLSQTRYLWMWIRITRSLLLSLG